MNTEDKKHILNGSQIIIDNHLNIKNTKVFLGSKYGPQGFGWTVPVNQNKLLIGVLTKGKSKEITKSFMKYLLDQYQIDKSGTEDIKTWGIPIKPINRKLPQLVKSLSVVYPYKLAPANVALVIKNTCVILIAV